MPIICGIYKVTSPTGKVYIGQSCDCYERLSAYRNGRCKKQAALYASIAKHGWSSHSFKVIFECPRRDLNKWEIFYIDLYNSFDTEHGMNLSSGGNMRYYVSESTKAKIKEKRKNQIVTDETRKKMSIFQKNRLRKKETYQKISEKLTGRKLTKEHAAKCSLGRKGKNLTEEHKRKIALAHTGKKRPLSTGLKISQVKKSKGLISDKHPQSKKVNQFTIEGQFIKTWHCSVDTKRELNYNPSHISACCSGKRGSAYGFKWQYA